MKFFTSEYKKLGRRRKRCRACSRLIQDGEMATFRSVKTEGYYPVKGIMRFQNWIPFHASCFTETYPGETSVK